MLHLGMSPDKGVAADRDEVVDADPAGQRGVVVNVDVSAHQRVVRDHDAIAESAIMSHVAARHQVAAATDRSDAFLLRRTPTDRDAFANHVVVADHDLRRLTAITQVLRIATDHDSGEQVILLAQRDTPQKCHVVFESRAAADRGVRSNHTERTDLDIIGDVGSRIDSGRLSNVLCHISIASKGQITRSFASPR